MNVEIKPEFMERIEKAEYMWFTSVREDGMPQPTPVWFVWENGTFLIYTGNGAQKHRNIIDNPHVALNYTDSHDAETYLVIMGEAVVDHTAPPPNQHPQYLAKYAVGIPDIGMTPDSFAQAFPIPIRVTPTRVRGE